MAESCKNLANGIDPSCEALKKLGGVAKRVWVGQISQLDAYGVDSNTLDINSLTMALTGSIPNTLKKFIGKKLKNSATHDLEVGENRNIFNQAVNLVLFYKTSRELYNIEKLANAEDVFVILENNDGDLEVYGIDTNENESSNDPLGGLNASAGTGGTGILLNDTTAYTLTLSGQHRIMKRIFNRTTTSTLAQNIAYLDSISE